MRTLCAILTLTLLSAVSASAAETKPAAGLANLPEAARVRISQTLGQDDVQFHARPVAGGFEASSGGLATRFTSTGVAVSSGTTHWGLAFRAYGYGDAGRSVGGAAPQANKNRVEYQRGAITEWYVNGPMGLEQGFTIRRRPSKANGLLTIALETSGNLTAVDDTKAGLTLTTAGGQEALRYAGLTAYDANGKELHASMQVQGERLLLQVDDRNARYPVVVDPVVQLAKLTSSDGPFLGQSVSISGNVVVTSATGQGGAAYVFVKPPSGWQNMTQTARLTALGEIPTDIFGSSVAISGNVIVVGAPGTNQNQGAAYVFAKPAGGWKDMTETAKLVASDGVPGDSFGERVAVSGSTAVVAAPEATVGGNTLQGAAYVYAKTTQEWSDSAGRTYTEAGKLTASDGTEVSFFGTGVAVSGDTVAVGADSAAQGGKHMCS